jgi:DegV family protein with EDD domain
MESTAIVTDSTSDLPIKLAEERNINIVPLSVMFEGKKYMDDGKGLSLKEFYRKLKNSDEMPLAAQPSPGEFMNAYKELLKSHKNIISIHISRKFSGTYNSALIASKQLPEARIEVMDSETVHMSCGFLAIEASRMASEDLEFDEIIKKLQDFKKKLGAYFCPFTLDNLIKGGRMNNLQGFFANMLSVKPILTIKNGEISLFKKVMKWEQAKNVIVDSVRANTAGSDRIVISVSDVDSEDEAEALSRRIKKEIAPDEIIRTNIGIVVGSHLGIGGLSVVYHT